MKQRLEPSIGHEHEYVKHCLVGVDQDIPCIFAIQRRLAKGQRQRREAKEVQQNQRQRMKTKKLLLGMLKLNLKM